MVDWSVLGIMVDFGKGVPYHLGAGRWDDAALSEAEDRLAETPCHAGMPWGHVVFTGEEGDRTAARCKIERLANIRLEPTRRSSLRSHRKGARLKRKTLDG
jgi:hypothetical protein